MKTRTHLCATLAAILVLSGCASGTFRIDPPNEQPIRPPVRMVDGSRDQVWDKAIAGLSKRFFVVNNMDRSSGFMNISYAGTPLRYIDCGTMRIQAKNATGEFIQNIPAASPAADYPVIQQSLLFRVNRRMDLEGRINLLLEATGPKTTRATVSARYVINRKATFTNVEGRSQTVADTSTMNTGGRASFEGASGMTCVPTGLLEQDILDAITE